jgi:DNA-binding PadR family transcriptional regulator
MHGYGIMQFIEAKTRGRVMLGAGTLYGAINTLLKKGWIEPTKDTKSDAKKNYVVTSLGKQIAEDERKRLVDISLLASKIIGGDNA